jgi:hypothetical protein
VFRESPNVVRGARQRRDDIRGGGYMRGVFGDAVTDAIYSAEYARALVRDSVDGAADGHDCMAEMEGVADDEYEARRIALASVPRAGHFWEPRRAIVGNSWEGDFDLEKDAGDYWREWYRNTEASKLVARSRMNEPFYPLDTLDETAAKTARRVMWHQAHGDLRRLTRAFVKSVNALGRLCAS